MIWIALVALSLLFVGVLGVRLFRQFMATVKELGDAGEHFSHLPSGALAASSDAVHVAPLGSDSDVVGSGVAAVQTVPGAAVFAEPAAVQRDYQASKTARRDARRLRRIERKTERGQPQALRDIDLHKT